ncbi:hypothetical protein BDB00DRAFT_785642 [Zychaea mexicana]|uniref:uncharacterized protein n=1 Tax=Zychaea mexicana TaxID=64656 RepID=UPI0022FEB1D1|nr:uncharacterized protein BDB00DRAFT_785642 [Zychaea mexicana]KAI9496195.1 hypothetical protein BDB00DRAFT_785642 [Zychaea mexicana]
MSQRMLDYNLARALFSASIPFNVVNNQEFATFLKRMRPGYAVPKPHVLQQYLLKEEHYDLIPQDQQQHSSSVSPLSPTYDSNGSNVIIAPQSPPSSSNSAAPSTSSAATISRIIHTQSISSSANGGNNGSNPTSDVGSSSTAHTSRVSVMHRPTEMDGSL